MIMDKRHYAIFIHFYNSCVMSISIVQDENIADGSYKGKQAFFCISGDFNMGFSLCGAS